MQSKILSNRILLIISFVGIAFFLGLLFKSAIHDRLALANTNTEIISVEAKAQPAFPVSFQIPSLNIDAPVSYVGLTPDGAMGVPKGPTDVAWFDIGVIPGENGSAVIDGHSGWKDSIPAVFDNLYKLHIGDKIYVKDGAGVTTTFVVRELRTYDPNQDASNVFNSSDGKSHLNLITCSGTWDSIAQSHSKRLVVFTDKVI